MSFAPPHEFHPHALLRGGHAQTLAGAFLPWRRVAHSAVPRRVTLADGDVLVLHDDCPPDWQAGDRIAVLMHGLAGDHQSGYMVRVTARMAERGIRTFRLDLRGCGAGAGLARKPYHAGCSDDVRQVVEFLESICPESPICLIGFSLSGNIVLKYVGEAPEHLPATLERAMAVNPPIELRACVGELDRFSNRFYDRHFVRLLRRSVRNLQRRIPDVSIPGSYRHPRRLFEFDDQYTAPAVGFSGAEDYYAQCSAAQFLRHITVPTAILTARDDPLVPAACFQDARYSKSVTLHIADGGGHLGYVARSNADPDRRWMDWRIVEWVTQSESAGK